MLAFLEEECELIKVQISVAQDIRHEGMQWITLHPALKPYPHGI